MNPTKLLQEISRRPLCCDGAMGTQLFARGLASEIIKRRRDRGRITETYEKLTPNTRNEPLDLRVYFLATVDMVRPNLTAIAQRLAPVPGPGAKDYVLKPASDKPAAPPPKPPARVPHENKFIGRKKWL